MTFDEWYLSDAMYDAWQQCWNEDDRYRRVWDAATQAERERCARVARECETKALIYTYADRQYELGWNNACEQVSERIREGERE